MEELALTEAQRDLQRLRGNHATQAAIAKAMGIDQSRVSRLEKGEIPLNHEELNRYLDAVGTDEARGYSAFVKQSWSNVRRPSFWHSERHALSRADDIFDELAKFIEERNPDGPFLAEIQLLHQSLMAAVEYLQNNEHRIAFVGDIGVGKSTTLCILTGLHLAQSAALPLDLTRRVALYTTTGGATICEARVKHVSNVPFGIIIQPQSMDDIFNSVGDLCASLMSKDIGYEARQIGVPDETSRALRNMAGLGGKKPKIIDGKSRTIGQAAELAQQFDNLDKFRAEFFSRLNLAQRTTSEIWHDENSGVNAMEWLQDTFAKVNNGLYPGVSLPKRISIMVPRPLFDGCERPIEIIDTKGVDGTAIRPDIAAYIDDERTLTILCSSYNSAPDSNMQRLMQHVIERGAEGMLADRSTLLIIPKGNQAESTRDDSGMIAESREESYEIKRDQVEAKLREIHCAEVPVLFFNAEQDDAHELSVKLLQLIAGMRKNRVNRIEDLGHTIQHIIENYEEARASAASEETRRQLRIFLDTHAALAMQQRPVYQSLLDAVREAHQRTIWATARRNGTWGNLDVYHHLGAGIAIGAQLRSRQAFNGLDTIIKQMLADEKLQPAHGFLNELKLSLEQWRRRFLAQVSTAGRELLRTALYGDDIWDTCADAYGTGSGYRDEIVHHLRDWFEHEDRENILSMIEDRIRREWEKEVLSPLRELCGAVQE